ncbi:RluA family pseudouridine synthase [Robertmurraya massiliosenegalensis]|uniref:RluA family pseudouridine synthase n=1 Tax=Robertmurraya massiliosenegalensis TaxID=1287657 RepID=UPI0002D4DA17
MSRFTLHWKIESVNQGKLVRDFLKEKSISKAALTDIKFAGGRITVNDIEVTVRKPLQEGDRLTVEFPNENRSESLAGEEIPLEIVFEDEYVLIVNKPAGIVTIPSREHPTGSLANGIVGYYEKMNHVATVHIVTRLDRDTSGLVLIAKHRHIHHLLSTQQKQGLVKRTYEALATGVFSQKKGTIEEPIGRKKDSIIEREVQVGGQYACTHYEVLQQQESFAHVRLRLETGRTHQIRVHLSHLGHPLIGDDLYGGAVGQMFRQALHCRSLSFIHPLKEEPLFFQSSLPEDMTKLL